jgi:hypothetical protein
MSASRRVLALELVHRSCSQPSQPRHLADAEAVSKFGTSAANCLGLAPDRPRRLRTMPTWS